MDITYQQKYYLDNNTYFKDYGKKYYLEHKDSRLEYQNNYNKMNRKNKGRLATKRELVKRNLKKNEKRVEEFKKQLNQI